MRVTVCSLLSLFRFGYDGVGLQISVLNFKLFDLFFDRIYFYIFILIFSIWYQIYSIWWLIYQFSGSRFMIDIHVLLLLCWSPNVLFELFFVKISLFMLIYLNNLSWLDVIWIPIKLFWWRYIVIQQDFGQQKPKLIIIRFLIEF